MTQNEFISLLKSSENINSKQVSEIQKVLDYYPYFAIGQLLLLKGFKQNDDINLNEVLNKTSLYIKDKRWLYNYIFESNKKTALNRSQKSSGDYFDIINAAEKEGGDVKQSLSELAKRLKKARLLTENETQNNTVVPVNNTVKKVDAPEVKRTADNKSDYAMRVRSLMQQKKYEEALEILKDLNLNNPKKNVYFADQIRFLEKIIENLKK